jgi:hypothetical protein
MKPLSLPTFIGYIKSLKRKALKTKNTKRKKLNKNV